MKWIFEMARCEFVCECGNGHPPVWKKDHVHGCCGCCQRLDFPGRLPERGDVAVCGAGRAGVVQSPHRRLIRYANGEEGWAWVSDDGDWSSRNPCIVGNFWDALDLDMSIEDYANARRIEGWPALVGTREQQATSTGLVGRIQGLAARLLGRSRRS